LTGLLVLNRYALFIMSAFLILLEGIRSRQKITLSAKDRVYVAVAIFLALASIVTLAPLKSFLALALFSVSLILARLILVSIEHKFRLLKFAFILIIVILSFSLIALALYLGGVSPHYVTTDQWTEREYYGILPFSLSPISGDLNLSGFFRPSGFYDEPGALSYLSSLLIIVFLCVGRWNILDLFPFLFLIPLATTSLQSLIQLLGILILSVRAVPRVTPRSLFLASATATSLSLLYVRYSDVINSLIVSRLLVLFATEHSFGFAGNRAASIQQSLSIFSNFDALLGGFLDPSAVGQSGGDFFTPLVYFGLFPWILYLVILSRLLIIFALALTGSFHSRRQPLLIASFCLMLLLLQRPYIFNVFWVVPTLVAFLSIEDLSSRVTCSSDRKSQLGIVSG
jgi:hypothetical protein